MARHRPFDRAPGTELEDRKRQRQTQLEKRTKLTSKMVDRASRRATETVPVENPAKHPPRNVQEYMDALAAQTFYRLGSREAAALTPAYLRLVRSAAEVESDGSAQVVMPWPPMRMSPSAIVALLAIGAVASAAGRALGVGRLDGVGHLGQCRAVSDGLLEGELVHIT